MFKKTIVKFTLIYSLLFFLLFWAFSVGIYAWMQQNSSIKYIVQKVNQAEQQGNYMGDGKDITTTTVSSIANEAALERLRVILLYINAILLFIIPLLSWFLARLTLAPIERAYQREKRFVGDASHELRTPLTIMSGEIEVALNKPRNNEEYVKTLHGTKEETDRLTALVENLLFLSRQDIHNSRKQSLTFESVDLTDATIKTISILKPQANRKNISLDLTLGEESIVVNGNAAMLAQVLFNLIHNAINYTFPGGKIDVALEKTGREVLLRVSDTGVGISKSEQNKIFDRFYRIDPSRSIGKGYGLGLSICKTIIRLHNGTILVESSLGNGSIFTVRLPLSIKKTGPV